MTRSKLTQLIIFTLMFLCLLSSSSALALTIAFPPNESFVEHEAVNMILQMEKNALDTVKVKVNDYQYPPMIINSGTENLCFGIILPPGINKIQVEGFLDEKKIISQDLQLFYLLKLSKDFNKPPNDFRKYIFHTPENEKDCNDCHKMEIDKGDLTPETPEDSPCYKCHNNKISSSVQHDPAAEWTCFECHQSEKGASKYSVPEPIVEICNQCHDQYSEWSAMKEMHGPVAVGQCLLCHDPHGSDWPAFTRIHTTDLCNNCHTGKTSGNHVLAGFFGKGHPTRGVPHPTEDGKEFTCAGCHDPHASNFKKMLRQDHRKMTIYCNDCHKK